ncbi:MAG TPA: hypothetical protein VFX28_04945 [Methylomirabilota bacterium]|nr:hypothetical protein [Methylomirabilota bacterium]
MSAPRRRSSALLVLASALAGCAIAIAPPHAPIPEDARRALGLLVDRWHAFSDLRALTDFRYTRGGERQQLTGVLLARAPASVRFEALSPFGQPFLLLTVHDERLVAYNAATNEAFVGDANAEATAKVLSLPFDADEVVGVVAGRPVPPKDIRVATVLEPDSLGPSLELVGRVNRLRVWMDFRTGVVHRLDLSGGRARAVVDYRFNGAGELSGFELEAAEGHLTASVRYLERVEGAGVPLDRFTLTLPKDAKTHAIR